MSFLAKRLARIKPSPTIAINTLAQVKVHCEYRTCAWWAYRTICTTFDVGFWL